MSPMVVDFDVAAIGGGGGGGCKYGGAGGAISNIMARSRVPSLTMVIGAAGAGIPAANNVSSSGDAGGTPGGASTIVELALSAVGGTAGSKNSAGSSPNGGSGYGGNRSAYPFNEPAILCSGGGGQGAFLNAALALTPGSAGGASYGGAGGAATTGGVLSSAANASGLGGGGGGSAYYYTGSNANYSKSGNGYAGCIMLRWRNKP